MKKLVGLIATILCCVQYAFSQVTITGIVCDSSNNMPLTYASIGIEGKNVGTVSDSVGKYSLLIPNTIAVTDSVTISYVGYKSVKFMIAQMTDDAKRIYLNRDTYNIKEIVVTNNTKPMKLGWNKTGTRVLQTPFFTYGEIQKADKISREKGVLMDSKYNCKVNSLNFFVTRNGYHNIKFRLSFYAVDNDTPTTLLIDENIIFDVSNRHTGWFHVDLSQYNIHLESGRFAVTLTMLDDKLKEGVLK